MSRPRLLSILIVASLAAFDLSLLVNGAARVLVALIAPLWMVLALASFLSQPNPRELGESMTTGAVDKVLTSCTLVLVILPIIVAYFRKAH